MGRVFEIKTDQGTTKYDTDTDDFGLSYTRDGKTGNYCLCVHKANGTNDNFDFTDKKAMLTEFYKAQWELLILHNEINDEYPVKLDPPPRG